MHRYANGLVLYRFESLGLEVDHAVFTRLGGVSQGPFATLNVGRTTGDDESAVAENHARIYSEMGLDGSQVITPYQVHGNRIAVVTAEDGGKVMPNTDGLATNAPGVALLLRFADCQPIVLYDSTNHALGLVHAGWRGVAQGIALRAVETMREAFGTDPRELAAGLGPAIGPCCYTVGDDVAAAMGYSLPDWRQVMSRENNHWRFDLPAANAQQFSAAGVRHVEQAGICTACRTDEFFSHRASGGRTGRFAAVVHLKPRHGGAKRFSERAWRRSLEPSRPEHADSLNPPGFPALEPFGEDDQ